MNRSQIRADEILSRLGANPRGAELGVSTGSLSRRLLVRKDLHLTMVDTWGEYRPGFVESDDYHGGLTAEEQQRHYGSAMAVTRFAEDRVTILKKDTVEAAKEVDDASLDFVFIDADHTYDGCRLDIEAWAPKLRPGGLLSGHDYAHPEYPKWGVKRAVDEFCAAHDLSVELGDDYTWFVRMPGPLPAPSGAYDRIIFCCVKAGPKYGPEYVNVLADMVNRNVEYAYRFICLTDDPSGLDEGIETINLPEGLEGWWNKVALFKPGLFPKRSRIVFLDLDVVIVGPLEPVVDTKGIAADWLQGGINSSVMVWDAGDYPQIREKFTPDVPKRLHGDQDWIEEVSWWAFLPSDWLPSYRLHCQEWPTDGARIVCFHGQPKPADIKTGWVPEMWTMNGLSVPRYTSALNNEIASIRENVAINSARDIPKIEKGEPKKRPVVIVGGGPSLRHSLLDIVLEQAKGAEVWALNGVHDYLISKGIIPDAMVMLDSREQNITFLQNPMVGVRYYLATQVHPTVFEAMEGYDVVKWTKWFWGVQDEIIVDGGCSVGATAPALAYVLGFRDMHLYGFDSSYEDGENHAYPQPMNASESMTEVVVHGQRFTAAKWMVAQVRDFQQLASGLVSLGCTLEIFGTGLLPTVFRHSIRQAA